MTATAIKGRTTLFVPGDAAAAALFEGALGYCGSGQAMTVGDHQLLLPTVKYDTNLAGGGPGLWNGISSSCTFPTDGYYLLMATVSVKLNGAGIGGVLEDFIGYFQFGTPGNHPAQTQDQRNMYQQVRYRGTFGYADKFLAGEAFHVRVTNNTSVASTVQDGSISVTRLGTVAP